MALDPITAGIDLANTVVSRIWPDKSAEEKEQLTAVLSVVQGQLAINQAEAASDSVFVAGWRPFIGWVCGAGCAWNWIGIRVCLFIAAALGHPLDVAPADLTEMLPLLMGMLGMSGLRSYEKIQMKKT